MNINFANGVRLPRLAGAARTLPLVLALAAAGTAHADEEDAKRILKSMSDYLGSQAMLSFNYDATLEIMTTEDQILGLASSGSVALQRPDKIHVSRSGGFADVDMSFDGKTLTVFGKNVNQYAQVEVPGNITNLLEQLRTTYQRTLPAADLLLPDSYTMLMADVTDIKDLGSGVIGGKECDSLAFRSAEVDYQIWIAQGDAPHPCRYVITSKGEFSGLQYEVQFTDWQTGDDVGSVNFSFDNTTGATAVDLKDIKGGDELPDNFDTVTGAAQ